MAKYDADVIPACVTCDQRSQTKSCKKCAVVYCKHFQSNIDLNYCANCISDIAIKETIIEKEVEHIRPNGTVSFSRKYQATMIKLQGVDWLFANQLIEHSTDAEIDAAIEYHRANVDMMLMERESRKQERSRKLAGIRIVHTPRESQHEREKKASKTRTKTKVKDEGQSLLDALTQLAKAGLTQEQIIAMIGGGK